MLQGEKSNQKTAHHNQSALCLEIPVPYVDYYSRAQPNRPDQTIYIVD